MSNRVAMTSIASRLFRGARSRLGSAKARLSSGVGGGALSVTSDAAARADASGDASEARASEGSGASEAPEPLPGVKPFVALFLDDESLARLKKRYPASANVRSASYVLIEPTEITDDIREPPVFGPLMGEKGKVEVVAKRTEASTGVTTLRAKVKIAGHEIDGARGYEPSIAWGAAGDDDVAHAAAVEGTEGFKKIKKSPLRLSGTLCRAEYWHGSRCHLEPLLECPLCVYMKQSPCKEAFTAWEDCLNASDAKGGTDEERQARFIESCTKQTLALKECVDKYPEFFGTMFGGEAAAAGSSSTSLPPDSEEGAREADAAADAAAETAAPATPAASSTSTTPGPQQ